MHINANTHQQTRTHAHTHTRAHARQVAELEQLALAAARETKREKNQEKEDRRLAREAYDAAANAAADNAAATAGNRGTDAENTARSLDGQSIAAGDVGWSMVAEASQEASATSSQEVMLKERELGLENRKAIIGISTIRRCWYGNPRAVPKTVRLDRLFTRNQRIDALAALRAQGQGQDTNKSSQKGFLDNLMGTGVVMPTVGDLPPLPLLDVTSLWDSLWYADGRDVTQKVIDLMRRDTRYNISYICLPNVFNDAFGDPSFGSSKVLVIEYRDSKQNNLTAVWSEKSSRPRVWENQDRQVVADQIASSSAQELEDMPDGAGVTNTSTHKVAVPDTSAGGGRRRSVETSSKSNDDQNPVLEGSGNAWLQQLLKLQVQDAEKDDRARDKTGEGQGEAFSLGDLFTDDSFSDDAATTRAFASMTLSADETEDHNPAPPPVIPFIKYASPGPPKSPWTSPDCTQPEFRILSLDGGGVRGVLSAVILGRILKEVPVSVGASTCVCREGGRGEREEVGTTGIVCASLARARALSLSLSFSRASHPYLGWL